MVSKNNKLVKSEKEASKVTHFSLRKLPIGLASVALGATLYAGATNANADTVKATTTQGPAEEQTDATATLPGTPAASSAPSQATTPAADPAPATSAASSADQSAPSAASSASSDTPAASSAGSTTSSTTSDASSAASSASSSATDDSQASSSAGNANSGAAKSDGPASSGTTVGDQDKEVTLTYYVHDDDNDGKVVYKGIKKMKPGQKFTYSEFTLPKNYVLVGGGDGNIGSEDYKVDVHAKHRVVTLAQAKSVPIERTITIHYPDNSVKTITQKGFYQSPENQLDEVTNEAKAIGEPTLTGIDAYQVPEVDGYTPNMKEVPALTPATYDGGAKLMVNVTYAKNGTNPGSSETPGSDQPANPGAGSTAGNPGSTSGNTGSDQPANPGSGSTAGNPGSTSGNTGSDQPANPGSGSTADNPGSSATPGSDQPANPGSSSDTPGSASEQPANSGSGSASNGQESATSNGSVASGSQPSSAVSTNGSESAAPAAGVAPVSGNTTGTMTNASTTGTGSEAQPEALGTVADGASAVTTGSNGNSSNSEALPQTGNDVSKELAALGLGTLGVVGTAALGMRKKKY